MSSPISISENNKCGVKRTFNEEIEIADSRLAEQVKIEVAREAEPDNAADLVVEPRPTDANGQPINGWFAPSYMSRGVDQRSMPPWTCALSSGSTWIDIRAPGIAPRIAVSMRSQISCASRTVVSPPTTR